LRISLPSISRRILKTPCVLAAETRIGRYLPEYLALFRGVATVIFGPVKLPHGSLSVSPSRL
jgi:hypothetical protein